MTLEKISPSVTILLDQDNLTHIYNDTRYGYLSDENAFSKMKQVKLKHPLHTLETMVLSKQQN